MNDDLLVEFLNFKFQNFENETKKKKNYIANVM